MITKHNFESTHIGTIDSGETETGHFFLDHHKLNKEEYYTVSKGEFLMRCFKTQQEAMAYFLRMIKEDDWE